MKTKYYCIDCNAEISKKKYVRCKPCSSIYHTGKKHAGYKNGKPKCIICKKELTNYRGIRCHSCEMKRRWKEGIINLKGKKSPLYIDGRTIKKYLCITCNKIIGYITWFQGNKRCKSCNAKHMWKIGIFNDRNFKEIKNPNWQGGIARLPYSFKFNNQLRKLIRKRDNYRCKKCKITEKKHLRINKRVLSIHHIDYDKGNYKKNNLITVCDKCNTKANYNRDYWFAYYTYIIKSSNKK